MYEETAADRYSKRLFIRGPLVLVLLIPKCSSNVSRNHAVAPTENPAAANRISGNRMGYFQRANRLPDKACRWAPRSTLKVESTLGIAAEVPEKEPCWAMHLSLMQCSPNPEVIFSCDFVTLAASYILSHARARSGLELERGTAS